MSCPYTEIRVRIKHIADGPMQRILMPQVPRKGETLICNGELLTVTQVIWRIGESRLVSVELIVEEPTQ
jgi:hypothetical protein